MPVKYAVIERPKPGDPNAPKKFYAIAVSDGEVTLRQLADQIANISTVSPIDTLAVLESLLQVIPDHLLNGRIVRLGDFGSFRLTLESNGADSADAFNKSFIKRVRLNFRAGKEIRSALKTADYEKA